MVRIKKIYRILITVILVAVIFLVLASVVVSLFYENAAILYLKKYLDGHLRTQITVDNIRFRLLKGFPNATFELRNIVILSGENFSVNEFTEIDADTLLASSKVTIQFDFIKLISKQYELKKIDINQGHINILYDKNKRNNLNVWKEAEDSIQKEYAIDLNSIHMNEMDINLISLTDNFQLSAVCEKLTLKGFIDKNILSLQTRGNVKASRLLINNRILLENTDLELKLNAVYSNRVLTIQEGQLLLDRIPSSFHGSLEFDQDKTVDLHFELTRFNLENLISYLPDSMKNLMGNLILDGNGTLNVTLTGNVSQPNQFTIHTTFAITNGTITSSKSRAKIENITLKGNASGSMSDVFIIGIEHFTSSVGYGHVDGKYYSNEHEPGFISARINSTIDLSEIYEIIDYDSIESMKGIVISDISAEWALEDSQNKGLVKYMNYLKKGNFVLNDVNIRRKNGIDLQHVNGMVSVDSILVLDSLSLVVDDNKYLVNGTLKNINGYIDDKDMLHADLMISLNTLDLSRYVGKSSLNASSGNTRSMILPAHVSLIAQVHANQFQVNKFAASDLDFSMIMDQDSIYINNFICKFIDGFISGNALINRNGYDGISVTCNAKTRYINIQELFTAFNNFAQHFIIDDNVSGRLNGSISFYSEWDHSLKLIPSSINALASIEITNGELIQFEPMMKLSRYFDVEELMHVRFSTLKNQIHINDRLITIPEMAINSSAFNITASGEHTFDNVFDYRLRVLLSEVLFNKAKTRRQEISEFYVESNMKDRSTIPLIVAGTPDNYGVVLDKQRAFSLSQPKGKEMIENSDLSDPADFIIEWNEQIPAENNLQDSNNDQFRDDFIIQWDEDENVKNEE